MDYGGQLRACFTGIAIGAGFAAGSPSAVPLDFSRFAHKTGRAFCFINRRKAYKATIPLRERGRALGCGAKNPIRRVGHLLDESGQSSSGIHAINLNAGKG